MLVHELISSQLKHLGVNTLFGLIGDANLFVANSFQKTYGGTFVSSANEAGAVLMAIGYASASGDIGVATVTCGPGFTNTLTALVEGVKSRSSIVLLAGQASATTKFTLQRIPQRDLAVAAGAGFEESLRLSDLAIDLTRAFQRALVERRPIVFNMPPFNLMWSEVDISTSGHLIYPDRSCTAVDNPDLDKAIGILATAKRPLIIAGYGAVKENARDMIIKLARRIEAPLMTTLRAKDLFYGDPANLDIFGYSAHPGTTEAVIQSDCIIAFGASLNFTTTVYGTLIRDKRTIFVNSDVTAIGKHELTDANVLGDCRAITERILYWLDQAEIPASGFSQEASVAAARAAILESSKPLPISNSAAAPQSLSLQTALQTISASLPQRYLLATGLGRHAGHVWHIFHVSEPHLFLPGNSYGAIGVTMAQAIGAAIAEPNLPTLVTTGDGAFMLGDSAEFATAVRYKLNMIVLVCNDGCYGAEYEELTARQLDPSIAFFTWPDFAAIGRALGGVGVTLKTPEDLAKLPAIIQTRDETIPLLIDLQLDPHSITRFQGVKMH